MDQSIDYNNQFQCSAMPQDAMPQDESLCSSNNNEDINNTINSDEINDTMNGTPTTPTDNIIQSNNNNDIKTAQSFFLDNIIVGYCFGPKKMETMGLIMAEASKAFSTFECSDTTFANHQSDEIDYETSSMTTMTTHHTVISTSNITPSAAGSCKTKYFADNEYEAEDTQSERSLSSTYTMKSSSQKGSLLQNNNGGGNINGIQLTFLPDSRGHIHLVRTSSSSSSTVDHSVGDKLGEVGASVLPNKTSLGPTSPGEPNETPLVTDGGSSVSTTTFCNGHKQQPKGSSLTRHHPIRVSFVPIDLDTPLSEQHGGKFDVILHKLTEDILCLSKMLRNSECQGIEEIGERDCKLCADDKSNGGEVDHARDETRLINLPQQSMSRHQLRASTRIQRLQEYKHTVHPSCVLVDSPNNILAVMSRADMATVLSKCLAGVTTKGGLPVRTPRFRVVNDTDENEQQTFTSLADEIDSSGFEYPLIAKPLTAAGTKSSHHMGIVLARDGLQRLKTPCLLQEFANHGQKLFKVYVLGDSVWVYSRESLPNLPGREVFEQSREGLCNSSTSTATQSPLLQKRPRTESYVEFERPAGSRCYVEFNSQRPYPKLSDFGIGQEGESSCRDYTQHLLPQRKRERLDSSAMLESMTSEDNNGSPPRLDERCDSDLAKFVTKEEIEPVTKALRDAFGLELFGFDVLVKHNSIKSRSNNDTTPDSIDGKEILVVDVNYFPGYKEVPNFPSLLAQYLTQKAVESRVRNNRESDCSTLC